MYICNHDNQTPPHPEWFTTGFRLRPVAIKIQHHFGHLNNNNKDGWNYNININHYSNNNSNNYIYHLSIFLYVTNSLYSQPAYLKQNRTLSLLPPSKYHDGLPTTSLSKIILESLCACFPSYGWCPFWKTEQKQKNVMIIIQMDKNRYWWLNIFPVLLHCHTEQAYRCFYGHNLNM